ncbi:MAG: division/cell wall cluster transcriptional repressor MraZ [Candidatus Niyogibacteria bacterium]|nr:division/cell wall cluster transcriptional repressor MraZ [Candidatus Niyogibacteria bacterium]
MLIGEYNHILDDKKRVSLPAKFRKELGGKAVITRGLDRCLFVYPAEEWQKFAEELSTLSKWQKDKRDMVRVFMSGAAEVETDKLGRILIPDSLKAYAELKNDVVICGMHKRVEIWNKERWENYRNEVEGQADLLAEKLGDSGMY